MDALRLYFNFYPILMVAVPIYLVLRLRLKGVFYGMIAFWILAVLGKQLGSTLTGSYSAFWLLTGLPIGLLYSGLIYVIYGCFRWIMARFVPAAAVTGNVPGFWKTILIAAAVSALFWQFRPYGMATSGMIEVLNNSHPEQVRFIWNEPYYFHNFGVIDMKAGSYRVDGDDLSDAELGDIADTTLTQGICPIDTFLSSAKLTRIRQLLDALPIRHKFIFQRFDFKRNIYLSLWKNGRWQTLEYDRTDLPGELAQLFELLGPNIAKAVQGDR